MFQKSSNTFFWGNCDTSIFLLCPFNNNNKLVSMLGSRNLSNLMVRNSGESQNFFLVKIKIEFLAEQRKGKVHVSLVLQHLQKQKPSGACSKYYLLNGSNASLFGRKFTSLGWFYLPKWLC